MDTFTRREFMKTMAIGLTSLTVPTHLQALASNRRRPGFVFFLADDLGWRDAGCYGSTFYETPHMDRLAASGMRFTDAYVAGPVCAPSRASIYSGKYTARFKLPIHDKPYPDNKKLLRPNYSDVAWGETTFAEALKKGGYRAFMAGKWHGGGDATQRGFDVWFGGQCGIGGLPPKGGYFSPYEDPRLPDGPDGEYLTDRLTDESLRFLDTVGNMPFLLYLSHHAVHMPLEAKEELIAKYERKARAIPKDDRPENIRDKGGWIKQIQDNPVYAGMIQSLDESLGRVLDKLDALGLREHTVVIFMSDNGGVAKGATANVPLRLEKGWLYEGGIRTPMIISCPGTIEPGTVCSTPVTGTDLFPTLLDLAGLPLMPEQHCDGMSLVPLLLQTGSLNREALYWYYPLYHGASGASPSAAIRAGDFKLIEFFEDEHIELYNLKDDIGEHNDPAVKMPEKAHLLRNMLRTWLKECDAKLPTRNPDWSQS